MKNAKIGYGAIAACDATTLMCVPMPGYSQVKTQCYCVRLAGRQDTPLIHHPLDIATVNAMLTDWPANPKEAARMLMDKHGPPNEMTPSLLTWNNNGPWKRTILHRQEIPHEFPKHHTGFLQQFVDYRVPPAKFSDLAIHDGSVVCERTSGGISARYDKEEMHFLALNLAHDMVTGKRSVSEAFKFYAMSVMEIYKGAKAALYASVAV